jgi:hypothetical protein
MEFPYTPHVESILRGRGMFKDGKLRCSATHCLFETDKKGFGREIEVKGTATCPNCTAVAKYPDDLEFEYASQHSFLKCPVCKQTISFSLIVWIQRVVSKHHRGKHLYFHKECDDATYHEVADEPEGTNEDVGTA